jgi:hypothetical protein
MTVDLYLVLPKMDRPTFAEKTGSRLQYLS